LTFINGSTHDIPLGLGVRTNVGQLLLFFNNRLIKVFKNFNGRIDGSFQKFKFNTFHGTFSLDDSLTSILDFRLNKKKIFNISKFS